MAEIQNEVKRKLSNSIQIIQEAQKLVGEIEETNPEVIDHLVEVIDKQSQLLNILIAQTRTGIKTETPEIDDGVTSVLDDYYRLKREEIRAKLTHLDWELAAKLRKQLGFEK